MNIVKLAPIRTERVSVGGKLVTPAPFLFRTDPEFYTNPISPLTKYTYQDMLYGEQVHKSIHRYH